MSHIPYRTGLKTLKLVLRKVCNLINKYRELWQDFMTAPQLAAADALYETCMAFSEVIDAIFAAET